MKFTSYAQNFEDVILWRAVGHIENGFYIDVGAQDPVVDSVSLAFHEHGWRGVHVEPILHYAKMLREQRPGDLVIQAAVGNGPALLPFFEVPNSGISTASPEIAQQQLERGFEFNEITVPCVTLAAIFKKTAGHDVHWLKIDVEGYEQEVLTSWGKGRIRPWIVVLESTLPGTKTDCHEQWEGLILGKGYRFAYFDGLNRFYVSNKHLELLATFGPGPNVFDNFSLNGTTSASFTELVENRGIEVANGIRTRLEGELHAAKNETAQLIDELQNQRNALKAFETNTANDAQANRENSLNTERNYLAKIAEMSEQDSQVRAQYFERERMLNQQMQEQHLEGKRNQEELLQRVQYLRHEVDTLVQSQRQLEQQFSAERNSLQETFDKKYEHLIYTHDEQLRQMRAQQSTRESSLHDLVKAAYDKLQAEQLKWEQNRQGLLAQVNLLQREKEELLHDQAERLTEFSLKQMQQDEHTMHVRLQHELRESEWRNQLDALTSKVEHLQAKIVSLENALSGAREEATSTLSTTLHREYLHAEESRKHFTTLQSLSNANVELQTQYANVVSERDHYRHKLALLDQKYSTQELTLCEVVASNSTSAERAARAVEQVELLGQQIVEYQRIEQESKASVTLLNSELCAMRQSFWWRLGVPLRWLQRVRETPAPISAKAFTPEVSSVVTVPALPVVPTQSEPREIYATRDIFSQEFNPVQPARTASDLLCHHDQAFVDCVYKSLLGREPDTEGKRFYLARLRSGISKEEIIAEVSMSPEGRDYNPNLPGLDVELRRYRKMRLPLIGVILRWVDSIRSSRAGAQETRAWENRILTLQELYHLHLRQIEQSILELKVKLDRQQSALDTSVVKTPLSESVVPKELAQEVTSMGFHRSIPSEKEIYFQLKSAIALGNANRDAQ
jgi:FkbM family methyltransferase